MDARGHGSTSDKGVEEDKYATAKREREEYADAVLHSPSRKKIVVAGPGTGKTHLFKRILEGTENTLTLTFVNALVEDLSLELCGLSEVKTLHSFARRVLKDATGKNVKVFPKLARVINEDVRILLKEDIDFDYLFHNRADEDEHIKFYKKRKDYYGHYGYSDIVFGAVKYFEANPNKIPTFGQVVVDEFQDFNRLEVSLIDLLAERSPILLVGDDDQALYESLKSASPAHIRERHRDRNSGYAPFALPYCSRCTRVIVEAANDIIQGARHDGYLGGRIDKPFRYFDDGQKDRDSQDNPHVIYSQLYHTPIPWFIEQRIADVAQEVRRRFTVLIISPTRVQCMHIARSLKETGFRAVRFPAKRESDEPTLFDGLKLLLQDKMCNLGWRVAARALLNGEHFEALLKETYNADAVRLSHRIEEGKRKEVRQMLTKLRAVRDRRHTEDGAELGEFLKKVGVDAYEMGRDRLRDEIRWGSSRVSNPGIRKTPVTITTIQGSKGLDADYVFFTHFDDKYLIRDSDNGTVSDQDICNVVVALTRAKRRVFLISSDTTKRPVFLNWIHESRVYVHPGSCARRA
jgi:superfamily I DNA/RNA helicase